MRTTMNCDAGNDNNTDDDTIETREHAQANGNAKPNVITLK